MLTLNGLPGVARFDPHSTPSNVSQRWEKWVMSLKYYLTAAAIAKPEQKKALLLHFAGTEVQEIFQTLPDLPPPTVGDPPDEYETTLEKLNKYFMPKKNISFERHMFHACAQNEGEYMDAYVTRLRQLSATCDFHNIDEAKLWKNVCQLC